MKSIFYSDFFGDLIEALSMLFFSLHAVFLFARSVFVYRKTSLSFRFSFIQKLSCPFRGEKKTRNSFFLTSNKKPMGRPKMESGKKEKSVLIRLSIEELTKLKVIEKEAGCSRSQLFVAKILNNSSSILFNSKELFRQLNEISTALGRVGNNINQLAKHANSISKSHEVPPQILADYNFLLKEYLLIQQDIHKSFRRIYREFGNTNDSKNSFQ